jgi:hypothetical protein
MPAVKRSAASPRRRYAMATPQSKLAAVPAETAAEQLECWLITALDCLGALPPSPATEKAIRGLDLALRVHRTS